MSDHDINPWETGAGLPLVGADATITDAKFGINAKIGADALCLILTFQPDGTDEEVEQSFSVGNGWEPAEKGDLLVSADGKPRKINANTNLGLLIDSIIGVGPFAQRGPAADTPPFADPKRASDWIGTRWTVDTHKVDRKNPQTGVTTSKDAYVFTAYLGSADDNPKGASKAAAKGAGAGKPAAKKADDTYGIDDDDLRAELIKAAKKADGDHNDFIENALAVEGVDGDSAVEKAVYAKKPGSLWAAVQAGDL